MVNKSTSCILGIAEGEDERGKKLRQSSADRMDRISALPEPLLHHILSFLPFDEVAQTSLLSKTWKQTWFTFPVLIFHQIVLRVDLGEEDEKTQRIRDKFEQTLRDRYRKMINLTKFTVDIFSIGYEDQELSSFVDQCVCYALGSNVKQLKLILTSMDHSCSRPWYTLPQMVLCSQSIVVLVLEHVKLESPISNVKLYSLTKLHLTHVCIEDGQIENLIVGCPLIEDLSIWRCRTYSKTLELFGLGKLPRLKYLSIICCYELKSIRISSPHLKVLIIDGTYELVEVKIETPSLCRFGYSGYIVSFSSNALPLFELELFITFIDTNSQWYSRYIEFLAKFNPKVLKLRSNGNQSVIVPERLRKILLSPLPSVKHLSLAGPVEANVLDGLLWIAPHLETISLEYDHSYDKSYFQFSYYEEHALGCCKTLPVSCWRHCIKELMIEVHKRGENVQRYSLEGEEILKKIDDIPF